MSNRNDRFDFSLTMLRALTEEMEDELDGVDRYPTSRFLAFADIIKRDYPDVWQGFLRTTGSSEEQVSQWHQGDNRPADEFAVYCATHLVKLARRCLTGHGTKRSASPESNSFASTVSASEPATRQQLAGVTFPSGMKSEDRLDQLVGFDNLPKRFRELVENDRLLTTVEELLTLHQKKNTSTLWQALCKIDLIGQKTARKVVHWLSDLGFQGLQ